MRLPANEILINKEHQAWWPAFTNDGHRSACSQPLFESHVEQILAVLGQPVAKDLTIELDTGAWDNYDSEHPGKSEGGTLTDEQVALIKAIIGLGSGGPEEVREACRQAEEDYYARGKN